MEIQHSAVIASTSLRSRPEAHVPESRIGPTSGERKRLLKAARNLLMRIGS
jgi:hypothetical protein